MLSEIKSLSAAYAIESGGADIIASAAKIPPAFFSHYSYKEY